MVALEDRIGRKEEKKPQTAPPAQGARIGLTIGTLVNGCSWGGVNWDTGNFRTQDPYADLERLAPYAIVVQIKTEIQRQGKRPEEADFKRLFQMLRAVNYRGYVALEYEAAEDPKTAVPRAARALKDLCG